MSGYELTPTDKACPACDGVMALDAVICTRCGLNLTTGRRVSEASRDPADANKRATVKPARTCAKCGYDLTGLGGRPCPECGQTAEGRRKGGTGGFREERRQEEIARYWKTTWMVGVIGLTVGVGLTFGVGGFLTPWGILGSLLHLGLCEVGLFVAYFVVCYFFIGFEEDVRGLALRLVGVGAVWAGLWTCMLLLPMAPFYGLIFVAVVTVLALVVPLHMLTGRDWNDCYWIAGCAWVVRFVVWVVVALLTAP